MLFNAYQYLLTRFSNAIIGLLLECIVKSWTAEQHWSYNQSFSITRDHNISESKHKNALNNLIVKNCLDEKNISWIIPL
jgi:hypothetical protein